MNAINRLLFVLPLFALVGCQQFERGGTMVNNFYDNLTGKTPLKAVAKMEDVYFADERRVGINTLSNKPFGRQPPYTTRYGQIVQTDKDYTVRVAGIRALNRSRDDSAKPIFIKSLDDENPLVRTEAAKALVNLPDESAVPKLIKLLGNQEEDRDARIAAARAMRNFKRLDVARALVANLTGRDFGVAWESRRRLEAITGDTTLPYDETQWLQFLTGPEKPFG